MNTLELKVTRRLSKEFSEELKLTNFSQCHFKFEFALEIDADFADQDEVSSSNRKQQGAIHKQWNKRCAEACTLIFNYAVAHAYDQQGEAGLSEFHRGVEFEIKNSGSAEVNYSDGAFRVNMTLDPREDTIIRMRVRPLYYDDHSPGPFENVELNNAASNRVLTSRLS